MNIQSYLEERRNRVNQALERYLSSQNNWPPKLKEAMAYSLKAGGKRIRPILAISVCEACGGKVDDVLPVALCLEMIHTFSLIHDDLPSMDNDDLRRGFPTNHKVFGEGFAVLAGDSLLAEAFYLLVQTKHEKILEVIQDIAYATGPAGMVGGQVLDLQGEGVPLTVDDLEKVHRFKTGRLLAVAVTSGAKIGGAPPAQLEALKSYGEKIGLAFQIADDILNVEGSEENLGKRIGSDAQKKKATYPGLLGLDGSKQKAATLTEEAIALLLPFDQKAEPLRELARYIVQRKS